MDLTKDKWLPVRLVTGEKTKISLAGLLDNAIRDVAWPRADFQGAAWQMLIGILQCSIAPEDEHDWGEIYEEGIEQANWENALSTLSPVLQFGSTRPSFLQSFEGLDSENCSIAGLLIEAPGGNTLKLNKDHFVKRHSVEKICPDCAVMALFSVQTNSPAGGAGYRVGMRGGGPLTTLVVPQHEEDVPLWKKLWLNVLPQNDISPLPVSHQFPVIFPWLAPTKTSEKAGNIVTPENAHPLQAYWGMPRRIELDFDQTQSGICDLCGDRNDALLTSMRTKNYGVQYDGWLHPFSPYRQAKKDLSAPWLSLKGQPGGLSYKDWLGLLCISEDKFNKTQPAKVVRAMAERDDISLWCFAWDMDNAKARCWYQQRIPHINARKLAVVHALAQQLLTLASGSLMLLRSALKNARFANPKEAKMDFSMLDIAFWQETEHAFLVVLDTLIQDPQRKQSETLASLKQWEVQLHHYVMNVFDQDALTDPDSPDEILLRQISARHGLDNDYRKQQARKDVVALFEQLKESTHA